jgi:hypothetical protein
MTDIFEYEPVFDFIDKALLIKGYRGPESEPTQYTPYILSIKIRVDMKYDFEYEIYAFNWDILNFINELTRIHKKTKGTACLNSQESSSYLNFEVEKSGELSISGRIMEKLDSYLNFYFESDQTVIPSLINILKELIK